MKYRKKPIIIEAMQYTKEECVNDIFEFFNQDKNLNIPVKQDGYCIVRTLEGDMKCEVGDYIIKGVKGEFYPCKPDIFEATYEKVEEVLQ